MFVSNKHSDHLWFDRSEIVFRNKRSSSIIVVSWVCNRIAAFLGFFLQSFDSHSRIVSADLLVLARLVRYKLY